MHMMMVPAVMLGVLVVLSTCSGGHAARTPLAALARGAGNGSGTQPQGAQQLGPQWQKLQAELQQAQMQEQNKSVPQNGSGRIPPSVEFVTIAKQARLQPQQQQQPAARPPTLLPGNQQQQQQQQQPVSTMDFKCGQPFGPCGAAIPDGIKCKNGPGWCAAGHFCGWVDTTAEPSRCLPLPRHCGKPGQACCPSNTDSPHVSQEDKLTRKPYCKDGATCFYFAPEPGLNNGDMYAANKGAYACAVVPAECGSEGKPCCPFSYHITTNPPLARTGCGPDSSLFCNYDWAAAGADSNNSGNSSSNDSDGSVLRAAFTPGRCERNAPDCGRFGRSCCVTTGGAATGLACGARWNETGPRGYCADPFDTASSGGLPKSSGGAGSSSSSSSSPGSGSGSSTGRTATYKELVCSRCPEPTNADFLKNPSRYWPC